MKPIGLPDPKTGRDAHAVVQLRREDKAGQMWNLVGFQTRLRIPEQQKVFRMIPGLEAAEFFRYGSIHRNSYLNAPAALGPALQVKDGAPLFFAGQLTGVEGYTESLGTGLLAGINLARLLQGQPLVTPPPTTMLGGLAALPARGRPGALPADERQLRAARPAGGEGQEDREEGGARREGARGFLGLARRAMKHPHPEASRSEDRGTSSSLPSLVVDFLTHLEKARDHSPHTLKAYRRDLEEFCGFLTRRHGKESWEFKDVDRLALRSFLGELERRGLARRSAARTLSAIRSFYKWLHVYHDIDIAAIRAAKIPRLEKRLPTYLLANR